MEARFEFIPLDNIKVQKHNVRVHDIDHGVEDLAANIHANGLLQPIATYYEAENGRYVILTGQRRLNAYHLLNEKYPNQGYEKIQCKIIDEPKSDEKKKALSLAENITQLAMTNQDLIKAVTDLYNVYGDYEMVQQEFGLTKYMVDKYVRLSRLPPILKQAVQDGEIHHNPKTAENMALRAVDAAKYTKGGPVSEDYVLKIAKKMAASDSPSDIEAVAGQGGDPDEVEEKAKKRVKEKITIDLSKEAAVKLKRLADDNGESEKMRATQYVMDGVEKDYDEIGD